MARAERTGERVVFQLVVMHPDLVARGLRDGSGALGGNVAHAAGTGLADLAALLNSEVVGG